MIVSSYTFFTNEIEKVVFHYRTSVAPEEVIPLNRFLQN